jgi:gluconolactonase
VISPDGGSVEHVPMPDIYTTNICFGGPGLRTAYVTLSVSGRLVAVDWPRPGLALNFMNR